MFNINFNLFIIVYKTRLFVLLLYLRVCEKWNWKIILSFYISGLHKGPELTNIRGMNHSRNETNCAIDIKTTRVRMNRIFCV